MPGGITGLSCSWGKWIQEPDPPGWGSLKNRDNKLCSWVACDSDLRKAGLAMPGKNWKVRTRLLIREGTSHQQTRNCLKNNQRENENNWSRLPDGRLTPGRTGRLAVRRNITLTWKWRYAFTRCDQNVLHETPLLLRLSSWAIEPYKKNLGIVVNSLAGIHNGLVKCLFVGNTRWIPSKSKVK
jgi:hypothetical protein